MDIVFTLVVLVLAVLIVVFASGSLLVQKLAQVGGIAYLLMIVLTLAKYLLSR